MVQLKLICNFLKDFNSKQFHLELSFKHNQLKLHIFFCHFTLLWGLCFQTNVFVKLYVLLDMLSCLILEFRVSLWLDL